LSVETSMSIPASRTSRIKLESYKQISIVKLGNVLKQKRNTAELFPITVRLPYFPQQHPRLWIRDKVGQGRS
jgi:hypothetical protein